MESLSSSQLFVYISDSIKIAEMWRLLVSKHTRQYKVNISKWSNNKLKNDIFH